MRPFALLFGCSLLAGCAALDPPTMPPPTSPKADDPSDDPPPTPSPPDMAEADTTCGGMQFQTERVPPNVMLVLDRSGSMGNAIGGGSTTSKWTDLKAALSQLVTSYDTQIQLGVSLYPADNDCKAGTITPLAPANGATVLGKINATSPNGNTPTAATLDEVRKSGGLSDPTRENFVVLATDGLPNCSDVDVAGKIRALYQSTPPVKTYVIGVGAATASNPALLNAWADEGHTARPGATKYYQTNSPAELKAAFDTIVGGIVSCTFKLSAPAPDPSQLHVWSNGTPIAADPTDGYVYDDAGPSITLFGAACDDLKANPKNQIQVVYGCPTPPPPPPIF